MKGVLSIQSFGREYEYRRAAMAILSFFSFSSQPRVRVLLFTDQPEWFGAILQGLPVEYVLLDTEKIKVMRGKIDFLHRMKIALIEETFERFPGHVQFYADSDTFFTADPWLLMQQVRPDKSSMHLCEYAFSAMKDEPLPAGKTFRDFYQLICTRKFSGAGGSPIDVHEAQFSWNAGVMIFHPEHKRFIADVYALTDQFYPDSGNHASEQYAFSVLLQTNTSIFPCDTVNYHYWYRIKKQVADQFLQKRMDEAFRSANLESRLLMVKEWTKILPLIFERHEWILRDQAIQLFNKRQYFEGYKWAIKAMIRKPSGSGPFIRDVLYHIKKQLSIEK